jgi:hypothetical protein
VSEGGEGFRQGQGKWASTLSTFRFSLTHVLYNFNLSFLAKASTCGMHGPMSEDAQHSTHTLLNNLHISLERARARERERESERASERERDA